MSELIHVGHFFAKYWLTFTLKLIFFYQTHEFWENQSRNIPGLQVLHLGLLLPGQIVCGLQSPKRFPFSSYSVQRGVPALSPDALNQFPAAPVPTLSGFPLTLPTAMSQPTGMPSSPAGSMPLNLAQPVMGINLIGPVGGAAAQASSSFMPIYPANQVNGETVHIPNSP